jgi:cysteine synthase A
LCQVQTAVGFGAYNPTGREIWQQTRGKLHAFVSGAGTGGTIAGVSKALKDLNPSIQIVLADPQGSSLFNKVRHHNHNVSIHGDS